MEKSCPFCDGKESYPVTFRETILIECKNCGAWGPRVHFCFTFTSEEISNNKEMSEEYIKEAWRLWNQRK